MILEVCSNINDTKNPNQNWHINHFKHLRFCCSLLRVQNLWEMHYAGAWNCSWQRGWMQWMFWSLTTPLVRILPLKCMKMVIVFYLLIQFAEETVSLSGGWLVVKHKTCSALTKGFPHYSISDQQTMKKYWYKWLIAKSHDHPSV